MEFMPLSTRKHLRKCAAFSEMFSSLSSVDAGQGWLIFALPPAELGVHPSDGDSHHELYLMCDDIRATMEELKGKGVEFSRPVSDQGWGLVTSIKMPGGGELGLYEPKHPTAINTAKSNEWHVVPRCEAAQHVECGGLAPL